MGQLRIFGHQGLADILAAFSPPGPRLTGQRTAIWVVLHATRAWSWSRRLGGNLQTRGQRERGVVKPEQGTARSAELMARAGAARRGKDTPSTAV